MKYSSLAKEVQETLKVEASLAFEMLSDESFNKNFDAAYAHLNLSEKRFLKATLQKILQQEEKKIGALRTEFNTASKLLNYDPRPTLSASTTVTLAEARLTKAQKRVNTFKSKF